MIPQTSPVEAASVGVSIAAPHAGSHSIDGVVSMNTSFDTPMSASSSTVQIDFNTKLSFLHLLRASLLRYSVTGVRCSAFVQDIILLNRYAALHGLDLHGLVDVRSCQQAIIHHLLVGQCFKRLHPPAINTHVNCLLRISSQKRNISRQLRIYFSLPRPLTFLYHAGICFRTRQISATGYS